MWTFNAEPMQHFTTAGRNCSVKPFAEFERNSEAIFEQMERDKPKKPLVGYKLMYNQIPCGEHFYHYLKRNQITVIHLVREAIFLSITSSHTDEGLWHSNNASVANHTRNSTPLASQSLLAWDRKLTEAENVISFYRTRLTNSIGVQYHFLPYERLLGQHREKNLLGAITSINPSVVTAWANKPFDSVGLLQLHEPVCSKRVADFAHIKQEFAKSHLSVIAACDYLER
jgi:hypothetical protein